MEAMFTRYEGLARKRAMVFSATREMDAEEVTAEALAGLLAAVQTWDESKGTFRTWMNRCVDYYMRGWSRNLAKWKQTGEPRRQTAVEGTGWMMELMDELSEEAQTVVKMCLDLPEEVQEAVLTRGGRPSNVSPVLQLHLHEMGWTWKQIWTTWKELKEVLS